MTFSRRAAAEMTRRAERIAARCWAPKASALAEGLTWAGTFHAIGARLLREHAGGDRPRPRLHHPRPRGFGRPDEPRAPPPRLLGDRAALSGQGHLPRDLLAGGQRAGGRSARCSRRHFPWCAELGGRAEGALRRLRRGEAGERGARLRRPAALLGRDDAATRRSPPRSAPGFDHVLVDEYQDTNRLQAAILAGAEARRPRPDRGRRRRAVDLRLPRRRGAQHPRLPGAVHAAGAHRHARAELPLDAADPRRGERGDRRGARGLRQAAAGATAAPGRGRRSSRCATRPAQVDYVCRRGPRRARGRRRAEGAGGAVPRRASLRPARGRARPAQHPLREVRRAEVPRRRPRQGHARLPAAAPRTPPTGSPASACCSSCPASARRPPRRCSTAMAAGARAGARARRRPVADARRRRLGRPSSRSSPACAPARAGWPAELEAVRAGTSRTSSACTTTPRSAAPTSSQLEAIAAGYPSRERFLTEITLDPPEATGDEAGPPHRDEDYLILSTIHSAKGQEWKRVFVLNCVDGCIPSDLATGTSAEIDEERRLLLRRDDPRPRRAAPGAAAALLRPRPAPRAATGTSTPPRSRFLPDRILDRFERRLWPPLAAAAPGAARRSAAASSSTSAPACARCGRSGARRISHSVTAFAVSSPGRSAITGCGPEKG